jgi:hypothetical protein
MQQPSLKVSSYKNSFIGCYKYYHREISDTTISCGRALGTNCVRDHAEVAVKMSNSNGIPHTASFIMTSTYLSIRAWHLSWIHSSNEVSEETKTKIFWNFIVISYHHFAKLNVFLSRISQLVALDQTRHQQGVPHFVRPGGLLCDWYGDYPRLPSTYENFIFHSLNFCPWEANYFAMF